METQEHVWSGGCLVSELGRAAVEDFLDERGYRGPALVHRVARVGAEARPYDLWAPWGRVPAAEALARVPRPVEPRQLARLPTRLRNRWALLEGGAGLGAWLFDGAVLQGRIILLEPSQAPRRLVRADLGELLPAWAQLTDERPSNEPEGAVVLDRAGELHSGEPEGRRTLAERPGLHRLLGRVVADLPRQSVVLHDDAEARIRHLQGPEPYFLVELFAATPVQLAADADLSPCQRQVATRAAAGATVREIAQALESGQETVRTHLRESYRRLGVANRLELARALTH